MLVLSREGMQRILIGNDIAITVVEIRGGKVRLGIDAPRSVPIARGELVDALKTDGQSWSDNPQWKKNGGGVQ